MKNLIITLFFCTILINAFAQESEKHEILSLTKIANNDQYGFNSQNPIRVGLGPNGGPANIRAYLDLLRDQKGKPVKYERTGSCCAYESPNGFMGMAMMDTYEITYLNAKGSKKKVIAYFSFYDYEEPMILFGFKTVE